MRGAATLFAAAVCASLLTLGLSSGAPAAPAAKKSPGEFFFHSPDNSQSSYSLDANKYQSESAQIAKQLDALVNPVMPLATQTQVTVEEKRWKTACAPLAALSKAGGCTAFATIDNYSPTARWVNVHFTYMPDGTMKGLEVDDSKMPLTDAKHEYERSQEIKKILLGQLKNCPKLMPIPSLPAEGVKATYQLWVKEPGPSAKNKTVAPSAANQDNGGQVKGRVVRAK